MIETTVGNTYWQELANAIVIQAVVDYRKLRRKQRNGIALKPVEERDYDKIRRFFCGEWFVMLTDIMVLLFCRNLTVKPPIYVPIFTSKAAGHPCRLSHPGKEQAMISERQTKSANFLCIISVLKDLMNKGMISPKEYNRAKKYYQQLTGADIILAE